MDCPQCQRRSREGFVQGQYRLEPVSLCAHCGYCATAHGTCWSTAFTPDLWGYAARPPQYDESGEPECPYCCGPMLPGRFADIGGAVSVLLCKWCGYSCPAQLHRSRIGSP